MNAASVEERAPSTAPSPSGVNAGDLVDEQAVRILGTLDGASAATLHGFAEGLKYVDGPASHFALPIYYLATNRKRGDPPDGLTLLVMRSALRQLSRDSAFIDKLENAQTPFWLAVRDPLMALQAECVAVYLAPGGIVPPPPPFGPSGAVLIHRRPGLRHSSGRGEM
jgi:hypothetical protein